jgi:nucleoside phosphorylase
MTGIVFATEEEAAPFLRSYKRGRFESLREGEVLYDETLFVSVTGIGKIKATLRTERFLQQNRPGRIIHAGTCTALRDGLDPGTLVAVSQVFEGDRMELAAPTYPRMPLDVIQDALTSGTLVTQDHVLKGDNELSYWQRIADMSDMTGYAVAFVTATYGIPCYVVKVVTGHFQQQDRQFRKTMTSGCERLGGFLVELLEREAASR